MRTLLAVLLGVLVGAGAFTFQYANGFAYLSDDPRACVQCHVMREHFDGWQKASHHGVATCNDCHLPHDLPSKLWVKAENGFWHSLRFTLQDFHEPIAIRPKNRDVLLANCLRCHGEMVAHVVGRGEEEPGALGCVRCHDAVGHGPRK
jgi:cytochrome c nitrite reductase small subunit